MYIEKKKESLLFSGTPCMYIEKKKESLLFSVTPCMKKRSSLALMYRDTHRECDFNDECRDFIPYHLIKICTLLSLLPQYSGHAACFFSKKNDS